MPIAATAASNFLNETGIKSVKLSLGEAEVTIGEELLHEEEKMYFDLYKAGDEEAKNILIERNLRLVAHLVKKYENKDISCVLVDEAQFLTEAQIEQLKDLTTMTSIDVLCYGLRTDFKTKLFPGSKRLFELADKVIELDNICDCGQHAIVNARFNAVGDILLTGSQIEIGGDEKYKALCWKCFKTMTLKNQKRNKNK